jgi:putative transcriptional regulator
LEIKYALANQAIVTYDALMVSLQGYLLVASPQLRDANFIKTILLMVQHNEQGALGLILNRPTGTTIGEAWSQVSETPCRRQDILHHGGPCEGPLMVLHGHESASQFEVASGIYFSAEKDNVECLIDQDGDPAKFFVGCAGWGPDQLEAELQTGSWLTMPATLGHIFCSGQEQWETVTRQIVRSASLRSLDPKIIPTDPSMN